jgi:hypothetical protein
LYLHPKSEIIHSLKEADLETEKIETFRTSEKGEDFFVSIQGRKKL